MREYRDYWGPQDGSAGYRIGFGFSPAVKVLLIVEIACFILLAILNKVASMSGWTALTYWWQSEYLYLTGEGAIDHFFLWQFVTSLFIHDPSSVWHLLFNMLMLFFFGPLVEQHFGSRKFLYLFLGAGIAGGLAFIVPHYFWAKHDVAVIGASGAVMGIVIAAAVLHPNQTVLFSFLFPIKLRTLAIIIVSIDVYMTLFVQHSGVASSAHLGGAFFGFMFVRHERGVTNWFFRWERRLAAREKRSSQQTRQRVEELLDKIHREGITSLTAREKKFLKKASEEYRNPS